MFFGLMLDAQFSNRIGDVGACAFGDSLKSNRSLKMLWLVSNLLIAAAAACAVLFHLTRQLKGGNVVEDAGACSLRDGLKFNCSLLELHLVSRDFHRYCRCSSMLLTIV